MLYDDTCLSGARARGAAARRRGARTQTVPPSLCCDPHGSRWAGRRCYCPPHTAHPTTQTAAHDSCAALRAGWRCRRAELPGASHSVPARRQAGSGAWLPIVLSRSLWLARTALSALYSARAPRARSPHAWRLAPRAPLFSLPVCLALAVLTPPRASPRSKCSTRRKARSLSLCGWAAHME